EFLALLKVAEDRIGPELDDGLLLAPEDGAERATHLGLFAEYGTERVESFHASRSCRFRRQLRSSPRMLRSTLEATSRTSALYCPLAITALSPETFSALTVLTSPTALRSRARSRAASETLPVSAAAGGSGATAPPSGRTAGPATAGSIGPFRSFTFMIQALTSGVF